jgi:hypothetical protein
MNSANRNKKIPTSAAALKNANRIKTADAPSFFELVYQVVRLIPKGRVTTYGAIAAYLGSKQSSRAVGYALKNVLIQFGHSHHLLLSYSEAVIFVFRPFFLLI